MIIKNKDKILSYFITRIRYTTGRILIYFLWKRTSFIFLFYVNAECFDELMQNIFFLTELKKECKSFDFNFLKAYK